MTTNKLITQGQVRQITGFGADVIEKVLDDLGLDKKGAQAVIGRGGEFGSLIMPSILSALQSLSVSERFKDEEVDSRYGYLSGYKPKGLNEQMNQLRILFPGIGFCNQDLFTQIERDDVKLPKHAEGWFAIPNWMRNPQIFGTTYSDALLKVLNMIKKARNGKFYNYREGQINEKNIHQSDRTREFWKKLSNDQGNPDILIVPAQFGIRHRGRSVRRACEIFVGNEFGLGAFAVGVMILTHPERLQNFDDLWIDCAGDEFAANADGDCSRAPYFGFGDSDIKVGTGWVDDADSDYGSASGFLPQ